MADVAAKFTCFFPKYGIQQSGFDRGKPNSWNGDMLEM